MRTEISKNQCKFKNLNLNLKCKFKFLYTDASFGNLKSGDSQGSCIIFLVQENSPSNSLSWQSKKLKRVV